MKASKMLVGVCSSRQLYLELRTLIFVNEPGFSYSLHYAQKHDRALRDPWSIRQTGFYQGYQNSGDFPVWILLQPSVDIQNALKKVVVSSSQHAEAALESHVIFTSAVSMRWSQYVEFLEHQYMESVCIYIFLLRNFAEADFLIEKQRLNVFRWPKCPGEYFP
jgi:hypothetical protein